MPSLGVLTSAGEVVLGLCTLSFRRWPSVSSGVFWIRGSQVNLREPRPSSGFSGLEPAELLLQAPSGAEPSPAVLGRVAVGGFPLTIIWGSCSVFPVSSVQG